MSKLELLFTRVLSFLRITGESEIRNLRLEQMQREYQRTTELPIEKNTTAPILIDHRTHHINIEHDEETKRENLLIRKTLTSNFHL